MTKDITGTCPQVFLNPCSYQRSRAFIHLYFALPIFTCGRESYTLTEKLLLQAPVVQTEFLHRIYDVSLGDKMPPQR